MTITFSSWKWFPVFINQEFLDYWSYIYRGHASERWKLESSLDRALRSAGLLRAKWPRKQHRDNFILAARGRRGSSPPRVSDDNEWWALGQHHGLFTPLLDWTESPFVALYFAFEDTNDQKSKHRVVYALHYPSLEEKGERLVARHRRARRRSRAPMVEIVRPISDENSRLVSQRGLFTRGPDGVSIDDWVKRQFTGSKTATLIRFMIPNNERDFCLRYLNRMNINHLSLFPDLYGASKYCNFDLMIDGY